ncbi:BTAD domain-containing putative transcriptional regulator [Micromonospora sp. IBSANI012]|uniref:BTAD domain-containing putative transcriptional regulator n=1 Tax=Micromonospora sp. IBSANI012 TaxID=3457761 RepID=UPI0040589397
MTQLELAQAAGISLAAVRDLEQGRTRVPRLRSVRSLAAVLGLSPEDAATLRASVLPAVPAGSPVREDEHGDEVRVLLLGPLGLIRGGRQVPLGTGRHRLVLARLALTPNTGVSRDELIDLLWRNEIPSSAVNLVQTYVSRLRRLLEPRRPSGHRTELLTLVAGGYRLNADPGQLDLLACRELLARAGELTAEPGPALALLDEALGLWRGAPLADVPELHGEPLVTALEEERIRATVLHARLAATLSRDDEALPLLRDLAARHPMHEPLQARLVAALAAAGQQAAALTTYEEVRRRLAEELGIDPGPELAEAHRSVLRQTWHRPAPVARRDDATVRPNQTPAPPADFTGRAEHLRQLQQLVERDPESPAPQLVTVCAISGVAGVGKTSLALRAAQLLRPAFPDGQLYVDLQGFGPLPVPPVDALARFLRALGVDGRRIPQNEAESAALFRSVLADRRVLLVLDNARNAAHVRPLLPGTGGNAVLVTSRNRLADLAGAVTVELGLPSTSEALDMLASSAGPARVAADADAAVELAEACGLLPIALRVAGGRLASRPDWTMRSALARLADQRHRLRQLRIGDMAVAASFDLSYQELPEGTARAFRLLALLPGTDFGVAAASVLLDIDEVEVEDALHDLVDGSLLQLTAGRYRYHDLLRLYAVRRAEAEDPAEQRAASIRRLLDWYLARSMAAVRLVYPEMVRLTTDVEVGAPFDDEAAALAWLDAELAGLTAAVRTAVDGPHPERSWQLADQLRGYFFVRQQVVPWLATGRAGLAAAQRAGNKLATAAMHQTIGQAYLSVGQHDLALTEYEQAASLARAAGWSVGLAYQLHNIGLVQAQMGRLDDAQESYRRALRIGRGGEFDHVRAVTLNDLGTLCHERGELTEAAAHFAEALQINQGASRRPSAMANRGNLGMVLRQLGEFDAARQHMETVLEHYRRVGSPKGELSVLDELSQLHAQRDEPSAAISAATRALELTRTLGDRRSEAALLSTLGSALLCAGRVVDAGARFEMSLQLAGQLSLPYFEVQARIGLSRVRLVSGAVEEAADDATRALGTARRVGYRLLEAEALLALARVNVAAGRDEAAEACCREALAVHPSHESSLMRQATDLLARVTAPPAPRVVADLTTVDAVARRSGAKHGGRPQPSYLG